jgi:hypothetical protein
MASPRDIVGGVAAERVMTGNLVGEQAWRCSHPHRLGQSFHGRNSLPDSVPRVVSCHEGRKNMPMALDLTLAMSKCENV